MTASLYVSIDRSGLTPRYIASPHMHPGAREWIPRDAVRVKPLEWFDVDEICTRQKAPALGGHYSLVEFDANTDEAHFAVNIDLGGLAFVFILERSPFGGRRPKQYPTLEAAKAAAQADYETRILSALAAPPGAQEEGEA